MQPRRFIKLHILTRVASGREASEAARNTRSGYAVHASTETMKSLMADHVDLDEDGIYILPPWYSPEAVKVSFRVVSSESIPEETIKSNRRHAASSSCVSGGAGSSVKRVPIEIHMLTEVSRLLEFVYLIAL